jgi:hypothetical protein
MATLKIENEEVRISNAVVDRIMSRLWRLGSDARRKAFIERARKRLTDGHRGANDIATVIIADHAAA